MKHSTAYHRLIRLCADMMCEALRVGRYPPPYTASADMARDKSAAFKCTGYARLIRDITALELALDEVLFEAVKLGQIRLDDESEYSPIAMNVATDDVLSFQPKARFHVKGTKTPVCGTCGGEGVVDSGGQDQASGWVNIPCPECEKATTFQPNQTSNAGVVDMPTSATEYEGGGTGQKGGAE